MKIDKDLTVMLKDTNKEVSNNMVHNVSKENLHYLCLNRISGLDIVRCIMNYMIVLLHAWAAFQYVDCTTWEFYGWTFVCNHLCVMAMPTFFSCQWLSNVQRFYD